MTTGWLLLLLVVVSSQSVDSQSTTDDETCHEGALLSKLYSDIERLLDSHQQLFRLFQQHQEVQFQQYQTLSNRLGKFELNRRQYCRDNFVVFPIHCMLNAHS